MIQQRRLLILSSENALLRLNLWIISKINFVSYGTIRIGFNVFVIVNVSLFVDMIWYLRICCFCHSLHHLVGGHRKSSGQVYVFQLGLSFFFVMFCLFCMSF